MGTARTLRPKRLGEKLAAIRKSFKLSQNELIRKLGFHNVLLREEISSFERDVRVPPPLVLLELARLAGLHVDDLLDDSIEIQEKLPSSSRVRNTKRQPGSSSAVAAFLNAPPPPNSSKKKSTPKKAR